MTYHCSRCGELHEADAAEFRGPCGLHVRVESYPPLSDRRSCDAPAMWRSSRSRERRVGDISPKGKRMKLALFLALSCAAAFGSDWAERVDASKIDTPGIRFEAYPQDVCATPEPGTWLLMGGGLALAGAVRLRKKK